MAKKDKKNRAPELEETTKSLKKKDKKAKDKAKKNKPAEVVEELTVAQVVEEATVAPEDNADAIFEIEDESTESPVEAPKVIHEGVDEKTGEVYQITASKGGSGKGTVAHPAPEETAAKPRAKRETKKVEIPASSLRFVGDFPVADILPRERSTRFRGKETRGVLEAMIQRFGWTQPLTLDSEHRIVDGQYRLELAQKWKLETVPVVITDGVSAAAGTTDLFHMLAGRIIEWDKWNYPETDAVLKGLDGGLGTEEILGFETTSEAGELRDIAREIGWFIEIIPKSLSGSTVTLTTLATLLKKQLAGKYKYDPAQILYIEALRSELEGVRREMVEAGETAGGVKPKLEQHVNEENRKQTEGNAIAEAKGYDMEFSEDGSTAVFTADAELTYVANKAAEIEEAGRVQVKSARDMASRFKEMADGKKLGLTQFKILAHYFSDMTPEEAGDFFNSTAPAEFNAFVDTVIEEDRTISPNRSVNFPMTEAELRAEQYRLRGEDIRKESEKNKVAAPKELKDFRVNELKGLLKRKGLPLNGNKGEIVARIEAAGFGPDDVADDSTADESEVLTADAPTEALAEDEDVSMVFAAEETSEESEELAEALQEAPDEIIVGEVRDVEAEVEAPKADLKALKKRKKELKAKDELTKAERKELKEISKKLKG